MYLRYGTDTENCSIFEYLRYCIYKILSNPDEDIAGMGTDFTVSRILETKTVSVSHQTHIELKFIVDTIQGH